MEIHRSDINDEADVKRLVDTFYDRVNADPLLAAVFNDVAQVNWPHHLPIMYRFWSSLLLGTMTYKGQPFPKHLPLPIGKEHFERWLELFKLTWGVVGMTVGLTVALQLVFPAFNFDLQYTTFGRIRPLHTNAVIFAFVGNGIFAGVYYSLQRLLQNPDVQRHPELDQLLGLATHHSGGRHYAAPGHYHLQRIRRTGMAHRHCHYAWCGWCLAGT
jgi:truncated hemoglobin YjbI